MCKYFFPAFPWFFLVFFFFFCFRPHFWVSIAAIHTHATFSTNFNARNILNTRKINKRKTKPENPKEKDRHRESREDWKKSSATWNVRKRLKVIVFCKWERERKNDYEESMSNRANRFLFSRCLFLTWAWWNWIASYVYSFVCATKSYIVWAVKNGFQMHIHICEKHKHSPRKKMI